MPVTMEPDRLQELACMLFGDAFPTPLPSLKTYSEAPATEGLDTTLASYCVEKDSGGNDVHVIYYNPDGDYTVLPNVEQDYGQYRESLAAGQPPLTLNEYAFNVTFLHEMGHWKQAQARITNSIGTTLHEYHNIVLHENKFPGRHRIFYAPITETPSVEQAEVLNRIATLDDRLVSYVFFETFNGLPQQTKASGVAYGPSKELLKALMDGYDAKERVEIVRNLLVDHCYRTASLKSLIDALDYETSLGIADLFEEKPKQQWKRETVERNLLAFPDSELLSIAQPTLTQSTKQKLPIETP